MAPEPLDDALPRVRLRHLRDLDVRCGLRLFHERSGTRASGRPSGDHGRFAVSSRIAQDARVAHTVLRGPTLADFPTPTDLFPEQQRLYDVSAHAYVALFGTRPAEVLSIDGTEIDRWDGARDDLGVDVSVPLDLILRDSEGRVEVRLLRSRRREVDDVERVMTRSRLRTLGVDVVHLVLADLLTLDVVEETIDLPATQAGDDAAVSAWLRRLDALAAQPRPKPGGDCRDCPYVAHCPPMRVDWTEQEIRAAAS